MLRRRLRNTYSKLTTVSAGYSNEPWPHRDTHRPVRQVIDAFGPERCVWGSAFPQALWTPARLSFLPPLLSLAPEPSRFRCWMHPSDATLSGSCAQENSYEQNLRVFQEEMGLSEEEQRWILSRTPLKLWFGGPRQIAPAL